jgi:hypothetical protein
MAKIAGMRWHVTVSARTTAATARLLPDSRPRMTRPRKTNANARLIVKANSPASVDAALPP